MERSLVHGMFRLVSIRLLHGNRQKNGNAIQMRRVCNEVVIFSMNETLIVAYIGYASDKLVNASIDV